jgi:hypothetical protein
MDGEVALFLLGSQLWGRSDDVVDDRNTVRSESMVEEVEVDRLIIVC